MPDSVVHTLAEAGRESDAAPLLRAVGVGKNFGGIAALSDARFELRAGEIHALMGEKGAG